MAVELNNLYKEIYQKYNVHLETTSCFDKKISWLHILEHIQFAQYLHGDELVFNASLNYATDEERKHFIDQLLLVEAGGLLVSVEDHRMFSQELIDYCNEMNFPLFTTDWETPFINITRIFSEILIDNEKSEMDLSAAFKNAILYPRDESLYLPQFEAHHFPEKASYVVSFIGPTDADSLSYKENMKQIEKTLQNNIRQCVIYEESQNIAILTHNYTVIELKQIFLNLTDRFSNLRFGIGSEESNIHNIFRSYQNAANTYRFCGNVFSENPLCYKDLGVYQILADMKEPEVICPTFVQNTLGKLIDHDKEHRTKYMDLLKIYFENDCSITQTADVTFYHQNTLKYKIKHIKEILGYDINSNEHRLNIMLSLHILHVLNFSNKSL